ncbi:glycosyltransferase family 20-domain-containing protein [Halteromyces radiatus]|uniref:glycosyltransferase family 20-domain-containing protein n=1 Tax=Halteromyces radiatus TaxID=101107 RepID=UPI00221F3882|nr:glycosyltransferase family 20-domain-containing protein [Halteromyces radiatus]KAI8097569.1 glycosyltransferase family 20-domain-containing protein [Halteromyces radiatus]
MSTLTFLPLLPLETKEKVGRLIHVTHQIPYEVQSYRTQQGLLWSFTPRHGHSAMYAGMQSLEPDFETLRIGWTGSIQCQQLTSTQKQYDHLFTPKEQQQQQQQQQQQLTSDIDQFTEEEKYDMIQQLYHQYGCIPLFLDNEEVDGHYYGYCKTMLWPLFNYILWSDATDGRIERKQWEIYKLVNQKYADMVLKHYTEGDTVWIHDYHLLLVPAMVRSKLPKARIGLFLHASFPSSEIFRVCPKREEILKGMLGANLIGFQTYANSRHFISNCTRLLGFESTPDGVNWEGHFCRVGTFPIGIDVDDVELKRSSPQVMPKMQAIGEMYTGKKILVGRDKLDLVKGVLQKLAAFEKFLTDYPEWQNKVVLIQVTDANTGDTTNKKEIEHKVSEMVARINGTFGSLEFTPVHHYHHHIQPDEYYALLSIADSALVTANRDGMSTVSLEYIMCQKEKHGPLILSELTGTAGSMSSALMVNPWDYAGVAKAINDALIMSDDEKASRHAQLLDHVKKYTASYWAHSFIKSLFHTYTLSEQSSNTPLLKIDHLVQNYSTSQKRLLCFDYDGTLTPICQTPGAAVPPPDMLKALTILCQDPANEVWVISGRDEHALDTWLGHIPGLGLSAEHGSFIKYPNSNKWMNLAEHFDMGWKHDVLEIFTYYTERTAGSFIEHKRCALTWHYRLADPIFGEFQAKECQNHLETALSKLPVEVLVGKKNLEVRLKSVNKGEIVKRLLLASPLSTSSSHLQTLSNSSPSVDFVMCCGDDKTDEDMFKTLARSSVDSTGKFSVLIGAEDKKTAALWRVPCVQEMIDSLTVLANLYTKIE